MLNYSETTHSTSATENTADPASSARKLTQLELERLVYGMAGQILQDFIDNGDEIVMDEWLPEDLTHSELTPIIYEQIGEQMHKIISDLEEESAKRDA